jgi:outer membrane protein assembly factor BamB
MNRSLPLLVLILAIGVALRPSHVSAQTLLYSFNTPNGGTNVACGAAVAAGDVDGDGKADVAFGCAGETVGGHVGQGRVYVFSGATGVLLFTLTTPNPQTNADFGSSVAIADTNGDGHADIIVGAPGEGAGRVYVFSGATGTVLRTLTSPNAETNGNFGISVSAGDVDADGKADVIVGASFETVTSTIRQGRVYAFSGATGSRSRRLRRRTVR